MAHVLSSTLTRYSRVSRTSSSSAGKSGTSERRARCRYEGAQALAACLDAVQQVFKVGGDGVMQTSKPFQRYLRDLMAMRNRPFGIPEARARAYAKCVLGVAPDPFKPGHTGGLV